MLQTFTVDPSTLGLLKRLQQVDVLENTRLVGGTALALMIGHRHSIDLDLFGIVDGTTESIKLGLLESDIEADYKNNTKMIHIFSIDGIKVDIVNYKYAWIDDLIECEGIRIAGMKDIAAMKLAAITNRGSRKDFIDFFFLLRHFTFKEMLSYYSEKYFDGNEFMVIKSITYFVDADLEPMPKMFADVSWEEIKERLELECRKVMI